MNDYEKFAIDIISVVRTGQRGSKVDANTVKRIADMLMAGPCITLWPRDAAEASQAVRDRAQAAKKPKVLPRPAVKPMTLPRGSVITINGVKVVESPAVPPGKIVVAPRPIVKVKP